MSPLMSVLNWRILIITPNKQIYLPIKVLMRSEVLGNYWNSWHGKFHEKACSWTIAKKSPDRFHSGMFPETVRPRIAEHDVVCVETDLAPYAGTRAAFGKTSTDFPYFGKFPLLRPSENIPASICFWKPVETIRKSSRGNFREICILFKFSSRQRFCKTSFETEWACPTYLQFNLKPLCCYYWFAINWTSVHFLHLWRLAWKPAYGQLKKTFRSENFQIILGKVSV